MTEMDPRAAKILALREERKRSDLMTCPDCGGRRNKFTGTCPRCPGPAKVAQRPAMPPNDPDPDPNPGRPTPTQDEAMPTPKAAEAEVKPDTVPGNSGTLSAGDAEVAAIGIVLGALSGLEPRAADRVIRYVKERLDDGGVDTKRG